MIRHTDRWTDAVTALGLCALCGSTEPQILDGRKFFLLNFSTLNYITRLSASIIGNEQLPQKLQFFPSNLSTTEPLETILTTCVLFSQYQCFSFSEVNK